MFKRNNFYLKGMFLLLVFSILSLYFWSCTKDSPTSSETVKLHGKILSGNKPLDGSLIVVDNQPQFSTFSDANGNFEIEGLSKGQHTLSVNKTFEDGRHLETQDTLTLNESFEVEIRLPKAISIISVEEILAGQVEVKWESSFSQEFREYKLYRSDNQGIDETTGELIYVSTNADDTTFVDDNLYSGRSYFYRVFVLNNFGRLGGSNVSGTTTENRNLISNGGFEELDGSGFVSDWSFDAPNFYNATFSVEDTNAQSGNRAIRGEVLGACGAYFGGVEQRISASLLEPGTEYEISVWLYPEKLPIDSTGSSVYNARVYIRLTTVSYITGSGQPIISIKIEGPKYENQWQRYSTSFTIPIGYVTNYYVNIDYCNSQPPKEMVVWIDNIELKRVE